MKNMLELKNTIIQYCHESINKRMTVCENRINRIQEDLNSETKSSAGDKHETGRAMLQLEREKLGHQLAIIEKDKHFLESLNFDQKFDTVRNGSLVFTNDANYFISISAGKICIDDQLFYCISMDSPIAHSMNHKVIGDLVKFRNKEFEIIDIC